MTGAITENYGFFSSIFCCGSSAKKANGINLQAKHTRASDQPQPEVSAASGAENPDDELFQPSGRFTLIFSELWKCNKPALLCGALFIVSAVLINAFVGVISLGTLSIPAASVSLYLCAAGSTTIWTAVLRACVTGNRRYGDQQQFVNTYTNGSTKQYKEFLFSSRVIHLKEEIDRELPQTTPLPR